MHAVYVNSIQHMTLTPNIAVSVSGSENQSSPKTARLSDKTAKFSFCPAGNFSLSDICPVILAKKR